MGSALRILTLTLLLALIFRKRCRIGPHVASFPPCVGCPGHPYFRAGVTFAELLAINLGEKSHIYPIASKSRGWESASSTLGCSWGGSAWPALVSYLWKFVPVSKTKLQAGKALPCTILGNDSQGGLETPLV